MSEAASTLDGADVVSGKCPVSTFAREFNPFDPAYQQDPYAVFAEVRQREPIFYSPEIDYWIVSRYDDIVAIFRDTETFSAAEALNLITPPCPEAMAKLAESEFMPSTSLVDEDPPKHSKRRRVIRRGITDDKVAELEPVSRRFVTQCLDQFVQKGQADMVTDLTFIVPALTAFALMGVPDAEVDRVRRYATRTALWIWGRPTAEQQIGIATDYVEYLQYAREHVERLIDNPGDDYMSNIVKAWKQDSNEDLWDKRYLVSIMQSHLYAAHETTTDAAAAGFKALLENREQWEAICADPGLIPNAVEEILRYQSSVPAWRRITTKPVKLGRYELPAGARIMMLTGSANHDEMMFADGDSFDITRDNADRHLAFGWGAHLCLGQNLARMEMRVMLEETTKRLPHLRLVEHQEWSYSPNTSFRGPEHVLAQWDPKQNPQAADRP